MSAPHIERQENPWQHHPTIRLAFPSPETVIPPRSLPPETVLGQEIVTKIRYDLLQPAVQLIALLEEETDLGVHLEPDFPKSGKPPTLANFRGTIFARETYYSVLRKLNTENESYRALRRAYEGIVSPAPLLPQGFKELSPEEQAALRDKNPEIVIRERVERFSQALFEQRRGDESYEGSPPQEDDLRGILRSISRPVLEKHGIQLLNPHPQTLAS